MEPAKDIFEVLMGSLLGCPYPSFVPGATRALPRVFRNLPPASRAPLLSVLRDFALHCEDATRHLLLLRLYQEHVEGVNAAVC